MRKRKVIDSDGYLDLVGCGGNCEIFSLGRELKEERGLVDIGVGAKKGFNLEGSGSQFLRYPPYLWLANDAPKRMDNATIPYNPHRISCDRLTLLAQPWHRWHPAFSLRQFPPSPTHLPRSTHHPAPKTPPIFLLQIVQQFPPRFPHSSPPLSHNMHLIHHQSRCM